MTEVEEALNNNEDIEIVFYREREEEDDEHSKSEDGCIYKTSDEAFDDCLSQHSSPPYSWRLPEYGAVETCVWNRDRVHAFVKNRLDNPTGEAIAPITTPLVPLAGKRHLDHDISGNRAEDDAASENSSTKFFQPSSDDFSVTSDVSGASSAIQNLLALCNK